MTGLQLYLATSSGALFLVSGAIGIRFLRLATRTRGVPECAMGTGLCSLVFFYLPVIVWSGVGRADVGDTKTTLLAFGGFFLWLGVTGFIVFTWRAFRPQAPWAMFLTALLSALCAWGCGGLIGALFASPADASSFEVCKFWTGMLRVTMWMNFTWTGIEGIHNYRMARKRLRLGLGDPVVANRFLLWGVVGICMAVVMSMSLYLHVQGIGMMIAPVALLLIAGGGMGCSVLMYLAFFPPVAYRRFLERHARVVEA